MVGRRLAITKTCEGCNKEFHPWSKDQRFCTKECAGQLPAIVLVCNNCGKRFTRSRSARRGSHVCCSRKCHSEYKSRIVVCERCGKEFKRIVSRIKPGKANYCSRGCAHKGLVVKKPVLTCAFCDKEFERYPSEIKKMSERGYRHVFCSHKCRAAMIAAQFNPPRPWHGRTGPTPGSRNTKEYKEWRKAVLERDDYTCQECGASDVLLTAHHVKAFLLYPGLRYEVSNGTTLCYPCHYSSHSHQPP